MKRLALIALLALSCISLSAQSSADKSRSEALRKEIRAIDKRISQLGTKASNAEHALVLTRRKMEAQKQLVAEAEGQFKALADEASRMRKALEECEARRDSLRRCCEAMVRGAYKNRDPRVWYMYLLSSGSFQQIFKRYAYLKNMSSTLVESSRLLEAEQQILEQRSREASERSAEAQAALRRHKDALAALAATEKSDAALVRKLKSDKAAQQKKLAVRKREKADLDKKMASMVSRSSGKAASLGGSFASDKGRIPWPVDGTITLGYGQHNHPVYKNVKLPFNNGVNISVDKGAKAYAVYDGEVRQIVVMPGYNKCVLVQHGAEYFTFYCKLGSVDVKTGQKVRAGAPIGTVETVGGVTEFHFQLWKGRQPQNPELWLAK